MDAARTDDKALQGDLEHFGLFEIAQSLMAGRKTALVSVQQGNRRAYLHFDEGRLVSALDDDLRIGETAAQAIFHWREGRFAIDFGVPPRECNVKIDTETLLLEVARTMDEGERDNGVRSADEAEAAVKDSLAQRFRGELNKIFKQVAVDTRPSRDRYAITAFDPLLVALTDLGGTALFLRTHTKPRVKTARGFSTIKQEVVEPGELEAFLEKLLSDAEKAAFRRDREISVLYRSQRGDRFRVSAFQDGGQPACIFSPASRRVPHLEELAGDAPRLAELLDERRGLLLLSGPLASGKSTLLAALIREALEERDRLVALFDDAQTFDFADEVGFLIRSDPSRFELGGHGGLAKVIEQGADLVAIDALASEEMLRDALAVASRTSPVLAVVESEDLDELAEHLARWSGGERAARTHRQFAEALIGVVDVELGRGDGASGRVALWVPDAEGRERLARGDFAVMASTSATS